LELLEHGFELVMGGMAFSNFSMAGGDKFGAGMESATEGENAGSMSSDFFRAGLYTL
jgi:hypothetical protein